MKDVFTSLPSDELIKRTRDRISFLTREQVTTLAKKSRKKIILFAILIPLCYIATIISTCIISYYTDTGTYEIPILVIINGILLLIADPIVALKLLNKTDEELIIRYIQREVKENYPSEYSRYISQELPTITKTISVNALNCSTILIDENSQKLLFQMSPNISKILSFSEISGYDVYEDGESKVKGAVGKALIGGAFFGLGGMILGSNMGRKISNQCTDLKLIIHISNLNCPQIVLSFVNSSCEKSDTNYKKKIAILQYICSTLEYIVNQKTLEESGACAQTSDFIPDTPSTKEKLLELKDLLEAGLITAEDYEQKKKQLLGL